MRARWCLCLLLLDAACADDGADLAATPDAAVVAAVDAAPASVEDLDLTVASYNALTAFAAVPGRHYKVATRSATSTRPSPSPRRPPAASSPSARWSSPPAPSRW